MEPEEEEWVTHALQEAERRKCISKVLSMEKKDAVPSGYNYASEIYRLKIKVLNNSGDVEERSVIYKRMPVHDVSPWVNKQEAFRVESRMYQVMLAAMERLLKSKDPTEEALWPELCGVKGENEGFLIEDLSVYGYGTIDRLKGLDFHQASLVLKNLAKFHALGAVILNEFVANETDPLYNCYMNPSNNCFKLVSKGNLRRLARAIKEGWPNEWHTYADGLNNLYDRLAPEITAMIENKDKVFKTLNHGDFYMNNILFKYDSSGTLMNTMRFVDYQMACVNSPWYDIHYLFGLSLRLEFFNKKHELLKLYHKSLEKYLNLFGYSERTPTYEELQRDFESTRLFGILLTLMYRPVQRNPSSNELHKMYGGPDDEESLWLLPFKYDGEEYLSAIRITLLQLRELGLL